MNDTLVTVVLAVYNVEKYLNRSVKSVISQTYENTEIILVDDGSTDNSAFMCDEWAKSDPRIKVVHKTNEGLSMARNTGIEEANGEFIFFLDSDDYVEEDLIENCVETALKTNAQIVVYGYDRIGENGAVKTTSVPELPKEVMKGEEIRDFVIPCLAGPMIRNGKKYHILSSAWGAMYSLKTIKRSGFRFVSEREIISEDIYSNLIYYRNVDCIATIPKVFYHYCENNAQSLTRTYNPQRFERNKHFYNEALKLCDRLCYPEQAKKNLSNQMVSNIIVSIKQTVCSDMKRTRKRKAVSEMLNDDVSKKVLSDYDANLDENVFRKTLIIFMKWRAVGTVMALIWIKNHL